MNPLVKSWSGYFLIWGSVAASLGYASYYTSHRSIPVGKGPDSYDVVAAMVELGLENRIIADETGKMLFISKSAAQLLGYEPKELEQKNVEILMPDEFKGVHTQGMNNAVYRAKHDLIVPGSDPPKRQVDAITIRKCDALTKDGGLKPVEIIIRVKKSGNTIVVIVTINAIETILRAADLTIDNLDELLAQLQKEKASHGR